MGNFGKKLLGAGALGAAAGAAVYYFIKKKNEDPDLQEEFADFQDNVKETAASAVNVASKLRDAVEKSVDHAVSKVKEHTDDFVDEDIFEEEDTDLGDDFSDLAEDVKKTAEDAAEKARSVASDLKEKAQEAAEDLKEKAEDAAEDLKEAAADPDNGQES